MRKSSGTLSTTELSLLDQLHCGMRSVIVVLYIARYCFPGTNVYMIPIVYLSLMIPTNLLFHLVFMGWHKLRPAATQA